MKEMTTVQQMRYEISISPGCAFNEIYWTDHAASGLISSREKRDYILTDEEMYRIQTSDPRLTNVNFIGLRNMWIAYLKKKGYVKVKDKPITYKWIEPIEIEGKCRITKDGTPEIAGAASEIVDLVRALKGKKVRMTIERI